MTENEPAPPQTRPPGRGSRWSGNWPWILLLGVLVLGAGAYFLSRDDDNASSSSSPAAAQVSLVPAVVGMTAPAAVQRLRELGYASELQRRETPNGGGRVLEQTPEAGEEYTRGNTVKLIVAHEPGTLVVPLVVGSRGPQGAARLRTAGLRARLKQVSSVEPKGRIVQQNPAGGAEAKRGSVVLLSVSKGQSLVRVPVLVGLTQSQAMASLRKVGLRWTLFPVHANKPVQQVVAQTPAGGETAPKGSAVIISISQGKGKSGKPRPGPATGVGVQPPPTGGGEATVPDVVGDRDFDALDKLRNAGFVPDPQPVASAQPKGTVLSQSPKGGSRAQRGSSVTFTVSGGPNLHTVPNVVGKGAAKATQILRNNGYLVRTEDRHVTDRSKVGKVVAQTPTAGTKTDGPVEVTIFVGRA